MRSRVHSAFVGVLLFCAIVVIGHSATITVAENNDSDPGSLRRALADANDGDTMMHAVRGTITLTSGELSVTENITVSGRGADQLSI